MLSVTGVGVGKGVGVGVGLAEAATGVGVGVGAGMRACFVDPPQPTKAQRSRTRANAFNVICAQKFNSELLKRREGNDSMREVIGETQPFID